MQMQNAGWCSRGLGLLLTALLLTGMAAAQDNNAYRSEVFGGYSWYSPGQRFGTTQVGGMNGFNVSSAWFFNRNFGFKADVGAYFKDRRANATTLLFGPVVKFPSENVTPFLHVLLGLNRMMPASGFPGNPEDKSGLGLAVGGGLDLNISEHWAIRAVQADYMWAHHNYAQAVGSRDIEGGRIGGGIVLKLGSLGPPPAPPALACSAQPTEVMAGEPVTVTGNASNFHPKATLTYTWTASGGKPSGNAATTRIDTTGLAPGSYTVRGTATDGKKASADCTTSFTVKEPPKNPPTISCSANPTSVKSGEPSTITAQAASPDNRPVTVTYSATAGRVTGSGNQATLDTAGAAPGPINITCNAADDRGLTATANTSVNVESPPPPPPQVSKLNEIQFKNKQKPARVDNEAKAILDDVALRLQRDADAKAVVVGYTDPEELKSKALAKKNANLAAQRAVNTRDYLVTEKGIDGSRIEARSDGTSAAKAEIYLVPAGATFDQAGTQPVDVSKVKAQPRTPAPPKKSGAKKKAAPAQ